MKIALIGYGKMGKAIEEIALKQGHEITVRIGSSGIHKNEELLLHSSDVAIEFTHPSAVIKNLSDCFEVGMPVVCGTTGWNNHFEAVAELCQKKDGKFFYASNFSLGVNIFFRLNEFLAKLMKNRRGYEVEMEEQHHIHKKDAPSGTAITLAETILENSEFKNKFSIQKSDNAEELFIRVIRENEIPGTHQVVYRSDIDSISISHRAHNRTGFATGAVLAAEFLVKQKPGIYAMNNLLQL